MLNIDLSVERGGKGEARGMQHWVLSVKPQVTVYYYTAVTFTRAIGQIKGHSRLGLLESNKSVVTYILVHLRAFF